MRYHMVAIEREYASGGREVGKRLADQLQIPYYGREILEMAAERKGTSVDYLEHLEETATGSLLFSLYMLTQAATGSSKNRPLADELYLLEANIIRELASKGPAVLIGRCASHVLRERDDMLRVFVRADMESRRQRAHAMYGIEEERVEQALRRIDKRRENYYTANTGKKWRDYSNYDIVLDRGRLGTERCVQLLTAAVD